MVKITSRRIKSRLSKVKAVTVSKKINTHMTTRLSLKKNCFDCSKPFNLKSSESKRKYCIYCQMKRVGKLSNCTACGDEYLQFKTQTNTFCYPCTIGIKGGEKHKCYLCDKVYYTNPDSLITKTSCYQCYLKSKGVKANCITCKGEFYVKKEDQKWKLRCQTCFFH